MELGWLESIFYGLIGGFGELLPVSAEAQRALYLLFIGGEDVPLLRLMTHIGALVAVLIACGPMLSRLNRERKLAAVSPKRRKRPVDRRSIADSKVLRMATIPVLVSVLLTVFTGSVASRLWLLALILTVNGVVLYAPQLFPSGNKESPAMSSLDAILIGFGTALGALPGLSRVGTCTSIGLMRGCQRRYALDMSLMLCIPALILLAVVDCFGVVTAIGTVTFLGVVKAVLAGAFSFAGAYFSTFILRFLAVRVGFSGFAYYSWGAALLSFILYLMI